MPELADHARLVAVRASGLRELTEPAREPFERLCRVAGQALGADASAVTLLDAERLRVVAAHGMERVDFPVGESVCRRVIETGAPVVVEDTRLDPAHGPGSFCVARGVIAYAGVPLRDQSGTIVGSLCAVEAVPRCWTGPELGLLEDISQMGTVELAARDTAAVAEQAQRRMGAVVASALDAIVTMDDAGLITEFNPAAEGMFGHRREAAVGRRLSDLLVPPARRAAHESGRERAVATGTGRILDRRIEQTAMRADGSEFPVELTVTRTDAGGETAFTGFLRDLSSQRRAERALSDVEARLADLAYVDPLTRLPNRAWLEETVDLALGAEAWTAGRTAALLFVDLDEFQAVNDSLGHAGGDAVLREAAARLLATTGSAAQVARQGADEFLVFVDRLGSEPQGAAERVALQVIAALAAPFTIADLEFHVEASVGMSLFPRDGDGFAELLRGAESALHQAKRAAGTRMATHRRDDQGARRRLTMSARLRRALAQEQFVLHYQPILELETGTTTAVEALLRWEDPEHGLIAPLDFISIAEATGLIVPIGAWVAEAACRQAAAWHDRGLDVSVGFNVSPVQLARGDFAWRLAEIIERTGAPADAMIVEVTESVAMEGGPETEEALERLSGLGVMVVIDDFGAGHSSLTRLRRLDIGSLKIDRALLEGVPGDPGAAAVVSATLALADALGIPTVAEGVETEAQRVFLRDRGCRWAQGFGLARPMVAGAVTERLLAALRPPAGTLTGG